VINVLEQFYEGGATTSPVLASVETVNQSDIAAVTTRVRDPRVPLYWRRRAERHSAERLHINVVTMTDQRNELRHLFTSTYADNM
jgi:hypothetical protein